MPSHRDRRRLLGGVLALGGSAALMHLEPVRAQGYPDRPVRIIVPMAPGGGADIAIRTLVTRLQATWSSGTVVDNRAGGTGAIGLAAAKIARADGYTIVLCTASHAALQATRRDLPYDLLRDFEPIMQITTAPYVLVINPHVKAGSVQELIRLSHQGGGELTYSSAGLGSMQHLAGALLASKGGARLLHVPYKGGGPALADVMAGQIHMVFATPQEAKAQVEAGRLRALAITGARRLAMLPDVPTMREAGLEDYVVSQWYGLLAPAGTPAPTIATLQKDIRAALESPDIVGRFMQEGVDVVPTGSDAFRRFLGDEIGRYRQAAEYAGLKSE